MAIDRPTPRRRRVVRTPWTPEEDQILIENIGQNPLNLKMCFISTSTLIRRSPSACASRWYSTLSKSQNKEHTGIITMGKHMAVRNRKRFKEGMEYIPLGEGLFQRFVNVLYDIIESRRGPKDE